MRQEEKIRFGARLPITYKDNGLLANLRRVERPFQGKNERILTVFAELIEASGLERALNAQPYTIFAPHNAAFVRFKRPPTQEALKQFIWDHVVDGKLTLGGGRLKRALDVSPRRTGAHTRGASAQSGAWRRRQVASHGGRTWGSAHFRD